MLELQPVWDKKSASLTCRDLNAAKHVVRGVVRPRRAKPSSAQAGHRDAPDHEGTGLVDSASLH